MAESTARGGSSFKRALAQVDAIQRPLSPALDGAMSNGPAKGLMAAYSEGQRRIDRLMTRTRLTGNADNAPELALVMVDQTVRGDLVAKAIGKGISGIQQLSTLT
ncbi:hypothetical protein [Roseateles aquatilis]|uniref:hypothetical protein n=1 Tax=Roseateles aquatilis TaxID=431061 RepID=UPI0013033E71|nr:hypothetical protein [Roseateles aquatilis]